MSKKIMSEENKSFIEKELEGAFFNDGYQLATKLLEDNSNPDQLLNAVQQLYHGVNSFIDVFLNNAESSKTEAHCFKGCAWCCHQAVFAQTHEFKYLKNWMFENLSAKEMEEVRIRAKEKSAQTMKLSDKDRLLYKSPCPLLKDNACMAYEARPMACRIYLSFDKDSCEYEYASPEDKSHFPKLFELPLRAGRKLNEGFVEKLKELGMDIQEFSIEEGLMK